MKILIVVATAFEVAPFVAFLEKHFSKKKEFVYYNKKLQISIALTGVGMSQTSYALGRILALQSFDLLINVGIAGAFSDALKKGDVVQVVSERFGDLGVEEADGSFKDMHELGLIPADVFPFQNGVLPNTAAASFNFLPKVNGLTVNKVHGYWPSIEAIRNKYDVDVETMEGAAFFQACLNAKVAFLQIRAISNKVETRNRENWEIDLAIKNLCKVLQELIETLA